MIWLLVAHITIGSGDVTVLEIRDRVFLRQDACEQAKLELMQDDLKAGRPRLDLECQRMGVVE